MTPSAEHAAPPLQMVLEGVFSNDSGDHAAATCLRKIGHHGAALMAG